MAGPEELFFLSMNIMISWFVSTLASVVGIAEYATVYLQQLKDAGKSFGEFTNTF